MKNILLASFALVPLISAPAYAQGIEAEVDLFEMQLDKGDDAFVFDSTFSIGDGVNGAVLKLEGGSEAGPDLDEVGAQLLYTRALGPGTTLLAGVRHDFLPGKDNNYAALAIEQAIGEIVEAESYFYLSEHGDATVSAQILIGAPLTESLTFEPRVSAEWSAQDILEEDIASGLVGLSLSARLRQAIGPVFNIYAGVIHDRLLGDTRDIARAAGDSGNATKAIIRHGRGILRRPVRRGREFARA